jgi:hypothetical protein
LHDFNAIKVGAGSSQARHNGIARVIFGCEKDDVALRRYSFATRPSGWLRNFGRDMAKNLALALVW